MYSTIYYIKNKTKQTKKLKAEKITHSPPLSLPDRTCPEEGAFRNLKTDLAVLHLIRISNNSLCAELHVPNPLLTQETLQIVLQF